jgi:hypothetical protein
VIAVALAKNPINELEGAARATRRRPWSFTISTLVLIVVNGDALSACCELLARRRRYQRTTIKMASTSKENAPPKTLPRIIDVVDFPDVVVDAPDVVVDIADFEGIASTEVDFPGVGSCVGLRPAELSICVVDVVESVGGPMNVDAGKMEFVDGGGGGRNGGEGEGEGEGDGEGEGEGEGEGVGEGKGEGEACRGLVLVSKWVGGGRSVLAVA